MFLNDDKGYLGLFCTLPAQKSPRYQKKEYLAAVGQCGQEKTQAGRIGFGKAEEQSKVYQAFRAQRTRKA